MKLERRMIKGLVALLVVLPLVSCGGAGNIEGGLDSSGTSVSADAAASDASADSGTTSSTSTLASRRSRTSTSSTSGTTTTTTSSGTTGGTTTTTTSSGTTGSSSGVLWTDGIQAGTAENWGFDYMMTESPIGTSVKPSDANGANISRVADPLGGAGYALRFYTDFSRSADGVRAEVDLLSQSNTAFAAQAKSTKGIWVAQEWYFPQALSAGNDDYPWLNLWDWHSVGADRWHTSPGVMVAKDGSMKVQFVWGGGSASYNDTTGYSSIAMPVGRWFSIEMHYVWSTSTVTVSLWIDGALALEQTVARTRADAHTGVEMNIKSYGATQGRTAWSPTPLIRYVRNVRFADGPMTVK
jgi:hypothetical protein